MENESPDEFVEKALQQLQQISESSRRKFDRRVAGGYDQASSMERPSSKPMTDLTRQEVDAKLAANKAEVEARLADFDASIKTGFAELRAEMADMRAEAHKGTADIIKWGIVTALGFATATVSILTFVINNAGLKQPAQPTAQPAPIVITVPGATAAPTQAPGPTK